MTWTLTPERFDTPDAARLLRDYYDELASRYWKRQATEAEIDEGLTDDGADRLAPPTGRLLVGRYAGEPASCVGVFLDPATAVAELTRVYVRPAFRRTGGGGLLMTAAEEVARGAGMRVLRLDTRSDLVEARGLYAKHGFREIPAYNDGPYADHWFAKEL
ncbi:GNAT family N-acetyltransferase [Streptomyces sp. NPDC002308]